jgi:hypothetical protein
MYLKVLSRLLDYSNTKYLKNIEIKKVIEI